MSLHEIFHRYPKNFPLPLVLDGSTGTSLMREGMPTGVCTEKWVSENPEIIKKIQQRYIVAGADAVYSPTFGANRPTLERNGVEFSSEFVSTLVSLSVNSGTLVGGDMSPTGLFIEPFGDTPFDTVVDIYKEQAKAMDDAGVDFFVTETNISLQEARAAVMGIRAVSDKPIFATVTVDENGYTLGGEELSCCFSALADLGVSAFGTNCSQGPEGMLELLRGLVPMSVSLGIPLIAKPNAGMPHEDEDGCRHFDLDAEGFSAYIPKFLAAGIPILGGCCGTDAGFIAKIRECVDSMKNSLNYETIPVSDFSHTASSTRSIVTVDDTALDEPIEVGDDFYDRVCDKEMNGAEYVYIHLPDIYAADIFIENAPMLTVPFAVCGDSDAIQKARRYYNGRLYIAK